MSTEFEAGVFKYNTSSCQLKLCELCIYITTQITYFNKITKYSFARAMVVMAVFWTIGPMKSNAFPYVYSSMHHTAVFMHLSKFCATYPHAGNVRGFDQP